MLFVRAFFRTIRVTFKSTGTIIIALVFVLSFALNIILMTWNTGAAAVAGAFSAVTGIASAFDGLQDANNKLRKQNRELVAMNSQMKRNKQEANKIAKRIASRTTRGALRNIAAVPAEALPNIGLAVVVGVTAYELADACETMKDISSLNNLLNGATEIDDEAVCGLQSPDADSVYAAIKNSPSSAWNTMADWDIDIPAWEQVESKSSSMWDNLKRGLFPK